jgi:isopentenyl diphosphate isomerase/L-lactate dehydrogenase-like FMN-dependent dehydrogenase
MTRLEDCYNIADLRLAARRRLPWGIFDYLDRGADDEIALKDNRRAFDRIRLNTKVMVPLDKPALGPTLFGKPSAMPYIISPTGMAGMCCHQGELVLAKAAAARGIPCGMATGSVTPMERMSAEAGGRLWFQLYMSKDRELNYGVARRAHNAGWEALMVTVDTGFSPGGTRENWRRTGFDHPFQFSPKTVFDLACHPGWLTRVILRYMTTTGFPRHENYPEGYQTSILPRAGDKKAKRADDPTWDDVARLRDVWPGKLIVKGILSAEDADQAVTHGADGIVVSNHGGRCLDSAIATIDALPKVAAEVGGKTTILLDSGIRRGADIVKALALGADAVMSGRCTLYGVAAGGQAGAEHALKLLENEYKLTMGYVGCRTPDEVGPHVIAYRPDPIDA